MGETTTLDGGLPGVCLVESGSRKFSGTVRGAASWGISVNIPAMKSAMTSPQNNREQIHADVQQLMTADCNLIRDPVESVTVFICLAGWEPGEQMATTLQENKRFGPD
jgi:hypothetical protein